MCGRKDRSEFKAIRDNATGQSGGREVELAALLDKATLYVMQFRTDFSQVIGIERYDQTVRRSTVYRGPRSRRLESEVFMTSVGNSDTYMTVRSVLKVDGSSLAGAHDRMTSILATEGSDRWSQLRALASEGAKYNLLHVQFLRLLGSFHDEAESC